MGEAAEEFSEESENTETQQGSEDNTPQTEAERLYTAKIEEKAAKLGWKADGPKNGGKNLSAEEFLDTLPDRFHHQSKEMKQLKRSVEGMAKTFQTTVAAQYQKGIKDAEERMNAAREAYDFQAYEKAASERAQLEQAAQTAQPGLLPEVEDFISRNEWFDKDKTMTADALIYKKNYLEANPGAPIDDVLDYVERRIKRDYPDYFTPKKEEKTATPPPSPEGNRSGGKPLAQWEKDKGLLSPLEKEMMRLQCETMHNGKPVTTEQKYIEMLRESGAFEGRSK